MKINPVTFAVTLVTMLVAHNVGDHICQTDHQAAHKAGEDPGVWVPAMAGHVASYQATQAVALAVVLPGLRPSWRGVLAGSLFSAASHAFLDRRWPVRGILRRTRSPGFAELAAPISGPYLADQALHHGCLFVAALLVSLRRS